MFSFQPFETVRTIVNSPSWAGRRGGPGPVTALGRTPPHHRLCVLLAPLNASLPRFVCGSEDPELAGWLPSGPGSSPPTSEVPVQRLPGHLYPQLPCQRGQPHQDPVLPPLSVLALALMLVCPPDTACSGKPGLCPPPRLQACPRAGALPQPGTEPRGSPPARSRPPSPPRLPGPSRRLRSSASPDGEVLGTCLRLGFGHPCDKPPKPQH